MENFIKGWSAFGEMVEMLRKMEKKQTPVEELSAKEQRPYDTGREIIEIIKGMIQPSFPSTKDYTSRNE